MLRFGVFILVLAAGYIALHYWTVDQPDVDLNESDHSALEGDAISPDLRDTLTGQPGALVLAKANNVTWSGAGRR